MVWTCGEIRYHRSYTDDSSDDANGTVYEHDPMGNQLRHGGDLQGLVDSLDYLQGMGIKAIYIAGSPMMNLPWQSDGNRHGVMIYDASQANSSCP